MSDSEQVTAFENIGGQPTMDRLVDDFYAAHGQLPEARGIRALHAADLGADQRVVLKKYLAEWLGGPKHYSARARPSRCCAPATCRFRSASPIAMPGCCA